MKRRQLGTALISFALLIAAAQGCNDSNDNAKPPDVGVSGKQATAGEGGEPSSGGKTGSNGGSTSTAGSTNTSGTTNEGGTGNEGGGGSPPVSGTSGEAGAAGAPPIPACTLPEHGANNCFNCPKEPVEWLNRCSDSTCEPFANKDRLPLLKADGTVPALPN